MKVQLKHDVEFWNNNTQKHITGFDLEDAKHIPCIGDEVSLEGTPCKVVNRIFRYEMAEGEGMAMVQVFLDY